MLRTATAVLLAAIVVGGCGSAAAPTAAPTPTATATPVPTLETHTIAGSIAVPASEVIDEEWTNACVAAPGYRDDIGHLKPVVLQDESGTIIGTGVLVLDASKYPPNGWSKADRNCHFTFAFLNAPNANFYTIGTGGIRKGITLSREELRATDWFVELSLG